MAWETCTLATRRLLRERRRCFRANLIFRPHRALRLALLLAASSCASAFEVHTHASISAVAFERSSLTNSEVQALLGLDRLEDGLPFRPWFDSSALPRDSDVYFDLTPAWTPAHSPFDFARRPMAYERLRINRQLDVSEDGLEAGIAPLRLKGWLMRGAIREDDLTQREYTRPPRPDPDPHGDLNRSIHHFYDPVSNSTFPSVPGVGAPLRSIDWALGVENALAPSFNPMLSRRNHFSWVDARRQLWLALTYKPSPGTGEADGRAAQARLAFMATAIKSLGQVLHHLQDAAQPQHSRKDAHNHSNDWRYRLFNASIARRSFEVFTEFRATGGFVDDGSFRGPEGEELRFSRLFGQAPEAGNRALPWNASYPIPKFATPVEFITTRHLDSDILARRGMADYSNRGFFTEGTLPRPFSGFLYPPDDLLAPGYVIVSMQQQLPNGATYVRRAIARQVPDALHPERSELVALATVGVFNQQGQARYLGGIALEDYAAQADNLIPRAVAYSAGLIDHFFRGRIEVRLPANGVVAVLDHGQAHFADAQGYPRRFSDAQLFGFRYLDLRLRNRSHYIDDAIESMASGELVAVAQYHRNPCYAPDLSHEPSRTWPGEAQQPGTCPPSMNRTAFPEISVSAPVAIAGNLDGPALQTQRFDFSADPIPVNATDLIVRVVYRGDLGEERGVGMALGMIDLAEPTFFALINMSDYRWFQGQWWRPEVLAQLPTFPDSEADPLTLNDVLMARSGQALFGGSGVDPERFLRVGVLLDTSSQTFAVQWRFNNEELRVFNAAFRGKVQQAPKARLAPGTFFNTPPIWRFRGLPAGDHFAWLVRSHSSQAPSESSYLDLDPLSPGPGGLYLPEPASFPTP